MFKFQRLSVSHVQAGIRRKKSACSTCLLGILVSLFRSAVHRSSLKSLSHSLYSSSLAITRSRAIALSARFVRRGDYITKWLLSQKKSGVYLLPRVSMHTHASEKRTRGKERKMDSRHEQKKFFFFFAAAPLERSMDSGRKRQMNWLECLIAAGFFFFHLFSLYFRDRQFQTVYTNWLLFR